MRDGITSARALTILARGMVSGTCPNCGQRSMFRGFYELHERCPHCGVRHEIAEGSWLGGVAIGYAFGALFATILTLIELTSHPLREAGLPPTWTIAALSIPVTVLAYRPAKGLWFSLMYLYGLAGEP